MTVIWANSSRENLEELHAHILLRSPATADRFIEELIGAVEKLMRFPTIGRQIPEMERFDLREISHRTYRIIYRLEATRIVILTVMHGKRDLSRIDFDRFKHEE